MNKKKPKDWLKTKDFEGYIILDPDGWDRKNFKVSWNEKITKQEMTKRFMMSTVLGKPRILNNHQKEG